MTETFADTTNATEIVLTYLVPVFVVVRNEGDGEGPYVEKVVVYDETDAFQQDPASVNDAAHDGELSADDERAIEAIKLIKDGESEWPSWGFGW